MQTMSFIMLDILGLAYYSLINTLKPHGKQRYQIVAIIKIAIKKDNSYQ